MVCHCCLHAKNLDRFLTFSANLTPNLSFDHNLCFRCPNGQCKHILDIYVLIAFLWYKKLCKLMDFHPCNHALKIQKLIWHSNSQHGSSLGSVRVHSLTRFALSRACDVTLESPFWLATLQSLALVTSSRRGLWHCVLTLVPDSKLGFHNLLILFPCNALHDCFAEENYGRLQ